MTDRLPVPLSDEGQAAGAERASATPGGAVRHLHAAGDAPSRAAAGTSPRTLDAVERWMVSAISGTEADAADASAWVKDGPRLPARDRLEIYRFGYHERLAECLEDDYRILAKTLGHERFHALCHAYVERHPSSSPNLNAFGRHFSAFLLEADLGELAPARPFLSELARLEWALVTAVHAAAPPPFELATLVAIPADQQGEVRFVPSDTVQVLRFEYPVNRFFQACRTEEAVPELPAPSPSATAVYRQGHTLWRMDLTPSMTRVLEALLASASLGEALAQMGVDETDPAALAEAERSVMIWFREWVQGGFFARLV